jgi:hypothetical protein
VVTKPNHSCGSRYQRQAEGALLFDLEFLTVPAQLPDRLELLAAKDAKRRVYTIVRWRADP